MRALWPIELEALRATTAEYPSAADAIRLQAKRAQVVSFENTGGGFFSNLAITGDVPLIVEEKSPLEGGNGTISGMEYGIGLLIWVSEGRVSTIEGYSHGGEPTAQIDWSDVKFEIRPWASSESEQP